MCCSYYFACNTCADFLRFDLANSKTFLETAAVLSEYQGGRTARF